jgi:tetratricopeptide (TPR) repeat protein
LPSKESASLEPQERNVYHLWGHALGEEEQSKHYFFEQLNGLKQSEKIFKKTYEFSELYHGWGDSLVGNKQYEKALEKYEEAINLNPRNENLYIKQGDIFKDKNEYEKAASSYRKAIHLKRFDKDIYQKLGGIIGNSQRPLTELCPTLEEVEANKNVEVNKNFAELYYSCGEALFHRREYQEALDAYGKATRINPGHASSYRRIGDAWRELHIYKEAIENYETSIKLSSEEKSNTSYDLGYVWGKCNEVEADSIPRSKTSDQDIDLALFYMGLSEALYEHEEYEKSKEKLLKAIEIREQDHSVNNLEIIHEKLGGILTRLGQYRKAIQKYEKAIELAHEDLKTATNARIGLAKIYEQKNQYHKAIEKYKEASKLDDEYVYKVLDMAFCCWEQGKYAEVRQLKKDAVRAYEETKDRAIYHKNFNYFRRFGYAFSNYFYDFKRAIETYEKGLEIDQNNVEILLDLADLYFQISNYDIAKCQQEIDPSWRAKELVSRAELILDDQDNTLIGPVQKQLEMGEIYLRNKHYEEAGLYHRFGHGVGQAISKR